MVPSNFVAFFFICIWHRTWISLKIRVGYSRVCTVYGNGRPRSRHAGRDLYKHTSAAPPQLVVFYSPPAAFSIQSNLERKVEHSSSPLIMAFRTMSRLVSLAFLITSVVAVAMPMPRPQALSKNCEQCLSLIDTSKRCGYDILSGDYTTVTELTCLCGIYSFVYEYKAYVHKPNPSLLPYPTPSLK